MGFEAFGGDACAALLADAECPGCDALERVVQIGELLFGTFEQRGDLLALERDGRAFGIVLVVEVGVLRGVDDRGERVGQLLHAARGPRVRVVNGLLDHTRAANAIARMSCGKVRRPGRCRGVRVMVCAEVDRTVGRALGPLCWP